MSDDELEAWGEGRFAQEAQDIAILQNEIAMEGEELAEMELSAEVTSSEIHFMDMFLWVRLLDPLILNRLMHNNKNMTNTSILMLTLFCQV